MPRDKSEKKFIVIEPTGRGREKRLQAQSGRVSVRSGVSCRKGLVNGIAALCSVVPAWRQVNYWCSTSIVVDYSRDRTVVVEPLVVVVTSSVGGGGMNSDIKYTGSVANGYSSRPRADKNSSTKVVQS